MNYSMGITARRLRPNWARRSSTASRAWKATPLQRHAGADPSRARIHGFPGGDRVALEVMGSRPMPWVICSTRRSLESASLTWPR